MKCKFTTDSVARTPSPPSRRAHHKLYTHVGNKMIITTPSISVLLLACAITASSLRIASAFSPQTIDRQLCNKHHLGRRHVTKVYNLFKDSSEEDDDLDDYDFKTAAQIRKARKLLRDAKKKIEEPKRESASEVAPKEPQPPLPFFASRSSAPSSKKIKSKTSSGIIADGATMSTLSASEPWELRPLNDLFAREPRSDYDGNIVSGDVSDGSKLAEKDLARNIMALKRSLQGEDFKVVFDQRNRWIGDIE